MNDTSEQENSIHTVYKEKLGTLIAENRSFFITGLIALVFIVYIFFLQLGDKIIVQFKNNIVSFLTFDTTGSAEPSSNLSSKLSNKSIDYLTPSQAPNPQRLEVNGQISAISSEQVTYTKNKYVVQKGDSLALIAQKVYGDRNAWVRIAQANNLASPDLIEVGMELVIPR